MVMYSKSSHDSQGLIRLRLPLFRKSTAPVTKYSENVVLDNNVEIGNFEVVFLHPI